jgi:hypothetical protein
MKKTACLFFHLSPLTPVINHNFRISPQIFLNIKNGPHAILRGPGETDSWKKNLKSKISCQTPFKDYVLPYHYSPPRSVFPSFFSNSLSQVLYQA